MSKSVESLETLINCKMFMDTLFTLEMLVLINGFVFVVSEN